MKKVFITLILFAVTVVSMADDVMKKDGNTYIVNTTTLCNTRGFKGTTPLEVHIQKGKVVKIVPLKNMESKGYYDRVKKNVLSLYEAMKVSEAMKLSSQPYVDGFSGATFTTKAVQNNINAALEYYKAHK